MVYHILPDCKNPAASRGDLFPCPVEKFYAWFIGALLSNPSSILSLIQESRQDIEIIRGGTYQRFLITDPSPSGCCRLKIQRIIIRSSEGDFLYSRALLPGLIIPYRGYSLLFVLNCLSLYYTDHKIGSICRTMRIDSRQLYEWVGLAEDNHGLIADFFHSVWNACKDLSSFISMTDSIHKAETLPYLYRSLCVHSGSHWIFLLSP